MVGREGRKVKTEAGQEGSGRKAGWQAVAWDMRRRRVGRRLVGGQAYANAVRAQWQRQCAGNKGTRCTVKGKTRARANVRQARA